MSRRRSILAVAVGLGLALLLWLVGLAAGGALSYRPFLVAAGPTDPDASPSTRPWQGAVHVHTRLSHDASGSIEQVAAEAAAAGLDYIVVADHIRARGVTGRVEGGWHEDVLVVVAEEISTDDGHLLALGIEPHPYALGPTGRQAIEDVRGLGGAPFIAHPLGGETPWTAGWAGAVGVEAWNLSTAVYRARLPSLLAAVAGYPVNRAWSALRLVEGSPGALRAWRQRVRMEADLPRRLATLGSVDAHGPPPALRWLGLPSHRDAFEALQTAVWLDEVPEPDPQRYRLVAGRLTEALARGRSAMVLTALGRAPALRITARSEDGTELPPGSAAPWEEGPWTIHADLGGAGPYRIRLLREDDEVATTIGEPLRHRVGSPGTYHVEVRRADGRGPDVPWIIANPVYVWPRRTLAAAEFRPVPPLPAPPVTRALLDDLGWNPESHPAASSTVASGSPGLQWELGFPREAGDNVFAALSWRPRSPVDLQGRRGLVVDLASPRPWRVAVRIGFAGADGERAWEWVVPTGPEGRAVGIPWDRFRPLHPADAGARLDAAAAGELTRISLVVTQERVRPGSRISVAVRGVGLFGGD